MDKPGLQGGTVPIKIGPVAVTDPYGHANDEYQADSWFADYFCAAMAQVMSRYDGIRPNFRERRNGGVGAFTPDNVPVFDWAAPNVYMIADSNHGFKMTGVGKLVARYLMGDDVAELKPFRFSRYAEGKTFGSSEQPLTVGVAATPGLRFVSLLGANGAEFYRAVTDYLAAATGLRASLVHPTPANLSELLAAGEVEAAFTCGLPYVRLTDEQPGALRLLAAPVLRGERYAGRPIYFSDFIVRAGASWQTLADLRGATFAFNQTESLSGYVLPLHHLHTLGETAGFFGQWQPTGSHAASLEWVERGQADVAALDSVVLAMELLQRPERAHSVRVVASAGPLAMPPVVAAASVPADTAQRLTRGAVGDAHDRGGTGGAGPGRGSALCAGGQPALRRYSDRFANPHGST